MMTRRYMTVGALSCLLAVAAVPLCAAETNPPPIPSPPAESMPRPPVTAEPMVWQPGHWDWSGNQYLWAKGQYVPAAGHGNVWTAGAWYHGSDGWNWVPAHWRS
jgi:hypothetical protein